jgi:tRNA uridine 5-carboxymethylaminomethyl modification enzyme
VGTELGLVPDDALRQQEAIWNAQNRAATQLRETVINPDRKTRRQLAGTAGVNLRKQTTWARLLSRPGIDIEAVSQEAPGLGGLSEEQRRTVIARLRYEGYVERHEKELQRLDRLRDISIPADFDPEKIAAFSLEVQQALVRHRPATLAEAERVPGMTPAALAVLIGHLAPRKSGEEHG